MNPLQRLGVTASAMLSGIAEVLAVAITAIAMALIVVASLIVRACGGASERRRLHRGRCPAARTS